LNNLFYTNSINGDTLTLREQEAVHCALVLRKKVGDIIYVIDGKGNRYKCGIDKLSKRDVECAILSTESQPKSEHITIAIAPTKNRDRLEWMIEKLVEIGVERIILMHTSNTERTRSNLDRLEKKAVSAVKQSLRFYIPEVVELDYTQVLQLEADDKYIAHCYDEMEKGDPERDRLDFDSAQSDSDSAQSDSDSAQSDSDSAQSDFDSAQSDSGSFQSDSGSAQFDSQTKQLILIGPEGDFTTSEVQQAFDAGFQGLDLGKFRLRTETAAIVAVTRFQ